MKYALIFAVLLPIAASAGELSGLTGDLTISNSNSPASPEGFSMHQAHKPDCAHSWHVLVMYQDGAARLTIGLTKKEADKLTAKMNAKWWPCGKAQTCTRVTSPGDVVGVDEFQ